MALNWVINIAYTITLGNSSSLSSSSASSSSSSEFTNNRTSENIVSASKEKKFGFQMPVHYPRYTKDDYENMEEWKIDVLLREYGLDFQGTVDEKRRFAMGAFLWPDQL